MLSRCKPIVELIKELAKQEFVGGLSAIYVENGTVCIFCTQLRKPETPAYMRSEPRHPQACTRHFLPEATTQRPLQRRHPFKAKAPAGRRTLCPGLPTSGEPVARLLYQTLRRAVLHGQGLSPSENS